MRQGVVSVLSGLVLVFVLASSADAGTIYGTLRKKQGNRWVPVPNAVVEIVESARDRNGNDRSIGVHARTDRNGYYRLFVRERKSYRIRVNGYTEQIRWGRGTKKVAASTGVVSKKAAVGYDLNLISSGRYWVLRRK